MCVFAVYMYTTGEFYDMPNRNCWAPVLIPTQKNKNKFPQEFTPPYMELFS